MGKNTSPTNAIDLLNYAVKYHSHGDLVNAEKSYRKALEHYCNSKIAYSNLGLICQFSGRMDEAIELYKRAIKIDPEFSNALTNLGYAYNLLGDYDKAYAATIKALKLQPAEPIAHINLGSICQNQGNLDQALSSTLKAIEIAPDNPTAYINLGSIYKDIGDIDQALSATLKSLELDPKSSISHMNLGGIYKYMGKLNLAIKATMKSLEIMPNNAIALMNMGSIYKDLGDIVEAINFTLKALEIDPGNPAIHDNLGGLYMHLGEADEAIFHTMKSLEIDPYNISALVNLSIIYEVQNNQIGQQGALDRALDLDPTNLNLHIMAGQVFGKIHGKKSEINDERNKFFEKIKYIQKNPHLHYEDSQPMHTDMFWLAYHDKEDDKLMLQEFCKALEGNHDLGGIMETYRKCLEIKKENDLIRIGVITDFWGEKHPVNLHYSALFSYLIKTDMRIIIIMGPNVGKIEQQYIEARYSTQTVRLTESLRRNCKIIKDLRLDLLLYPDIGMSSDIYLLGLIRLAPVQVVMAGHPCSTGLREMDYFLSSKLIEPHDAQKNYTEQLIKFQKMPTTMANTKIPRLKEAGTRLNKNKVSVGVIHSLFKITHEFDATLEYLARTENNIKFILFETHPGLAKKLKERWEQSAPCVLKKSIFLPRASFDDYIQIVRQLDLVLDPFGFGAGTVFYQAMSCGVPLVTWPKKFLKTMVAAGGYKQMQILEPPTAKSKEEYINICKKLINSKKARDDLSNEITRKAKLYLFDHRETLVEYEQFIRESIAASRKNKKLPIDWQSKL